jgi:hypothetical protein
MFPSWSYPATSAGSPTPSSADTPNSAFGMLLEAAHANDTESVATAIPTPPLSPDERDLTDMSDVDTPGSLFQVFADISCSTREKGFGRVPIVYTKLSAREQLHRALYPTLSRIEAF